jgi:hypothetical protein
VHLPTLWILGLTMCAYLQNNNETEKILPRHPLQACPSHYRNFNFLFYKSYNAESSRNKRLQALFISQSVL